MKRALVLSGGGAAGSFQVGVLKRLMGEQHTVYDVMTGVSVGALNIAGIAMIPKGNPEKAIKWVESFWLKFVETNAIYKRWFPFGRLHSLWQRSVYDSNPLIKLITDKLDQNVIATNGRELAVTAVNLDTGERRLIRETDPNFIQWVLASASFPVFLKPIEIEGSYWSDGGLKSLTPIGAAIKLGATDIDVVSCYNLKRDEMWNSSKKRAVPDQIIRVLDMSIQQLVDNDLKMTALKNKLSLYDNSCKHVNVRVFAPRVNLTNNTLNFEKSNILRMIDVGYHADVVETIS